jgi:hypothetical protein
MRGFSNHWVDYPAMRRFYVAILLFLMACAPASAPTSTPQMVSVFATASTQPWLSEIYTCAQTLQIEVANINDPNLADISLRIGEPESLTSPVYQIGHDDILIVTHRESPVQNITLEQARALFANPASLGVEIWVFASGDDLQQVFTHNVMQETHISTLAHLAVSPQQMSDTLNNNKNTIGILPRRWKAGTMREVFTLPDVPVLAILKTDPSGAVKQLLACLQK